MLSILSQALNNKPLLPILNYKNQFVKTNDPESQVTLCPRLLESDYGLGQLNSMAAASFQIGNSP